MRYVNWSKNALKTIGLCVKLANVPKEHVYVLYMWYSYVIYINQNEISNILGMSKIKTLMLIWSRMAFDRTQHTIRCYKNISIAQNGILVQHFCSKKKKPTATQISISKCEIRVIAPFSLIQHSIFQMNLSLRSFRMMTT